MEKDLRLLYRIRFVDEIFKDYMDEIIRIFQEYLVNN